MTAPAGPAAETGLEAALADRAEALCAVPSPVGEEGPLCDELEREARALFPAVRRVKNSLVVQVDGAPAAGSARPLVALCGHLDTIPVPEPDRGRRPRREQGRLVATGATDMKGGLAVAWELAARLPQSRRFADLLLVLYAREEGPFLENELGDLLREAPELRRTGLAICLEPTDNHLQLGCVGSIHATLAFHGRQAHSARPWHGENAIHRAGTLLAELAARPPREAISGGLTFREVASVTRIEGGRARNVIPDLCTLNLNFRFAPDRTLEEAAAEVEALAARFGAEAVLTDRSPACPAFAGDPLVRRLAGRSGALVEPKQAWTDVARLAQAGIPAVNLGPGSTGQAHQAGEWVELAALTEAWRRLSAFLVEDAP